MKKIYLSGLQVALRRFEQDGKYAKCGHWSIAKGGYDLWWELYWDGYAVLQCVSGKLIGGFRPIPEFTEDVEQKVINRVKEVYPDLL
jgi:hypothetical protein